jgi:hypothetical protein
MAYVPVGATANRGSAPRIGPAPGTTQQLACDNSEVKTMRAVVGAVKNNGSAPSIPPTQRT